MMLWLVFTYLFLGATKTMIVFRSDNPGMKPLWMLTSTSAPRLIAYFTLYSLAWPFIREPSLWKAFKVLITGGQALEAYFSRLEAYGLGPRLKKYSSSADMNVCRQVRREYAEMHRRNSHLAQMISLEYKMQQAAELVAMCVLGPTEFEKHTSNCDITWDDTIVNAAKSLIDNGRGSSFELRIIEAVGDDVWSKEFAERFDGLLHFI